VAWNAPGVDHSPLILNDGNQPAPVMAYIENNEGPDDIGISPTVANLSKVIPIRVPRDFVPSV
jgi:hypothetical protein